MADLLDGVRVTHNDVREIGDFTEDAVPGNALTQFINMAHVRTNEVDDGNVGSTKLKLIELNLAADYATALDPQVIEEDVADANFRYKGDRETTDFREAAVDLDPTGTLAEDESKEEASFHVFDGR